MSARPLAQHLTGAFGTEGAVTSSHPAVSQIGARVLAGGGNAIDATVAMAAMSWLVLPGQCGLGGDAFGLVREPDGRTWTAVGSGFGPDGGSPAFYRDLGHDALPLGGPLSVAVPGAVGVFTLLAEHATRSLAELWEPAARTAERGVPCTAKTRGDIAEHAGELAADPDARAMFLPDGRLPHVGERLVQRLLAATMRRLAADPDAFHTGWFADRALTTLVDAGAPFSGEEWALGADVPAGPAITTTYAGRVIHETPPPSPGWMVLHQAAVLDGAVGELEQLGAPAIHWFAEAARASFRHRFDFCGSDDDNWRNALSEAAVCWVRQGIGRRRATSATGIGTQGDTTSTVCVDAEGRAVSFIQSLAFTFGARTSVPGTGVLLNNRLGRGAYLIDGHPNEVRPRRRPMHTLNAWLATDGDDLVAVGNCPGGDGQVQWNMQVLSHLLDHGDDPARAVALPRVSVLPGSDANTLGTPPTLRCEEGVDEDTLTTPESRGHRVGRVPAHRGGPGGSALAITLDRVRGVLHAAADPRMEGVALAL
jgi:gamma-glutamyltranspeptidase/glutathione hydrolase